MQASGPADLPAGEWLPVQWLLISLGDDGCFWPPPGSLDLGALTLFELALAGRLNADDDGRLRVRQGAPGTDGVLGMALEEIRSAQPASAALLLGRMEIALGGLRGCYVQVLAEEGILVPLPGPIRRRRWLSSATSSDAFSLADPGPRDRARQSLREVLAPPVPPVRPALLAWMLGLDKAMGVKGPRQRLFSQAERRLAEEYMRRIRKEGIPSLGREPAESRDAVRAVLSAVAALMWEALYSAASSSG